RPLFVCGLSIAMAATSLVGSSSVALAATRPSITTWSISAPVYEGDRPFVTATFTDPDALDLHTVDVSWGDDSSATHPLAPAATTTNLAAGVSSFSSDAYTYAAVGDFTVTLTVTDNAGASATATSSVSVHQPNQAPSVALFSVTAGSEGGSSALALTFADVDALDTHTVSVAWGDGSTSEPTVLSAEVTVFDASHVYAATGALSLVVPLGVAAGVS